MTKKLPRTAWKEGQSGNPNGRPPKGYSITETIKAMMDEKPEIKKALGNKILEMALKGDITAMKTLWQYMDGMLKQTTDITSGGEPLKIETVNYAGKDKNPV